MKILARGEKIKTDELRIKLAAFEADLKVMDDNDLAQVDLNQFDVVFDLDFDQHPYQLKYYAPLKGKPVFVSAVKTQLAKAVHELKMKPECKLFGMNALPTFINRSLAELSAFDPNDAPVADEVMKKFGWDYRIVEDRVGMVTPRIIFMIINEACYTVQEGTASMKDIDVSMKLGTNYPFGPFEWADKIGVDHVFETLDAIYNDTHDERYKICPLLKTKYLKGENFYS